MDQQARCHVPCLNTACQFSARKIHHTLTLFTRQSCTGQVGVELAGGYSAHPLLLHQQSLYGIGHYALLSFCASRKRRASGAEAAICPRGTDSEALRMHHHACINPKLGRKLGPPQSCFLRNRSGIFWEGFSPDMRLQILGQQRRSQASVPGSWLRGRFCPKNV